MALFIFHLDPVLPKARVLLDDACDFRVAQKAEPMQVGNYIAVLHASFVENLISRKSLLHVHHALQDIGRDLLPARWSQLVHLLLEFKLGGLVPSAVFDDLLTVHFFDLQLVLLLHSDHFRNLLLESCALLLILHVGLAGFFEDSTVHIEALVERRVGHMLAILLPLDLVVDGSFKVVEVVGLPEEPLSVLYPLFDDWKSVPHPVLVDNLLRFKEVIEGEGSIGLDLWLSEGICFEHHSLIHFLRH